MMQVSINLYSRQANIVYQSKEILKSGCCRVVLFDLTKVRRVLILNQYRETLIFTFKEHFVVITDNYTPHALCGDAGTKLFAVTFAVDSRLFSFSPGEPPSVRWRLLAVPLCCGQSGGSCVTHERPLGFARP